MNSTTGSDELVIDEMSKKELIDLRNELRHHRGWINNRLNSIRAELEKRESDEQNRYVDTETSHQGGER